MSEVKLHLTRDPNLFRTYTALLVGDNLHFPPIPFSTVHGDITVYIVPVLCANKSYPSRTIANVDLLIVVKESSGTPRDTPIQYFATPPFILSTPSDPPIIFWYKKNGEYIQNIEEILHEYFQKNLP